MHLVCSATPNFVMLEVVCCGYSDRCVHIGFTPIFLKRTMTAMFAISASVLSVSFFFRLLFSFFLFPLSLSFSFPPSVSLSLSLLIFYRNFHGLNARELLSIIPPLLKKTINSHGFLLSFWYLLQEYVFKYVSKCAQFCKFSASDEY